MTEPLITVLLPVFNAERTLKAVIESLRRQTLTDWECLLLDDASSDGTWELATRMVADDSRFRLLRNPMNMGLAATLNRGLFISRGRYIARVDGDDPLHPERFALQIGHLEAHPETDLLGSAARIILNGKALRTATMPPRLEGPSAANMTSGLVFHSSTMIRRRFFENHGLYETRYPRAEDRELWVRALKAGARFANLPDALIDYESAGWIRSYRTIREKSMSTYTISRKYGLPAPWRTALLTAATMIVIKWRLYRPRSAR